MSSAGQLVGGFAGAIIGFVGSGFNPTGALYGAQVGLLIGGYLDPPKGPKLNNPKIGDLRVQTSTLGAFIPRAYNRIRVSGNVFWVEGDKIKPTITKVKSSGGKGGGKSKSTSKQVTYSATFAVGLADTKSVGVEIKSVGKIWINGELWYDLESSDPDTVAASIAKASSFAFYPGSATQSPDPRMQADKGAANTPAYRGLAYIVFYDLQLAKYANSLSGAQVKLELITKGSSPPIYTYSSLGYAAYGFTVSSPQIDFGAGLFVLFQNSGSTTYYTSPTGVTWTSRTRPSTAMAKLAFCKDRFFAGDANAFYTSTDGITWSGSLTTGFSGAVNQWEANTSRYAALLASGPTVIWSADGSTWNAATLPGVSAYDSLAWNGSIWAAISSSSGNVATSPDLVTWTLVQTVATGWSQLAVKGPEFVAKKSSATAAVLHSPSGSVWTQYATAQTVISSLLSCGDEVCFMDSHSEFYNSGVGETVWHGPETGFGAFDTKWRGMAWDGAARIVTVKSTVDDRYLISKTLSTPGTAGSTTLAEIVRLECLQSGFLAVGDLDVTSLTPTVPGYVIAQPGAIRAALEPLQGAWPFDVVQSGYKIKFVLRETNSFLLTVPESDLGAYVVGTSPPARLQTVRELDTLLPKRVGIQYLNPNREYELGYQYEERLNTLAINNLTIELPLALTDEDAAGIAQMLLYIHWTERQVLQFVLPPTYLALEASDIIGISTPEGVIQVRLTNLEISPSGLMKCEGRPFVPTVYSPVALGASPSVVGVTTVPRIGGTLYQLLDIPRLSSVQDSPSMLVAMRGQYAKWEGGSLFKSIDAGATWTLLANSTSPGATMGTASNALGAVDSRLVDNGSSLSVTLTNGALYSVTQSQMFAGSNYFAYGAAGRWEIIAAAKCTLVTGTSYTLRDFLRGCFGTEWAMSLHSVGDAIILLDTAEIAAFELETGAIGVTQQYRAITEDRDISTDSNLPYAYAGVNLRPLSPVYLKGSISPATSDWTLETLRRTRKGGEWRDYVDADLGESVEQYQFDIFADGTYTTVKRTITSAMNTCQYLSTEQVADFGSNQTTLYVKVYQMSAIMGRGYGLTATLIG